MANADSGDPIDRQMTKRSELDRRPDEELRLSSYLRNRNAEGRWEFRAFLRDDLVREDHCCDTMFEMVERHDYLRYDRIFRHWYILTSQPHGHLLTYCPFCGVELPSDLRGERYEELTKLGYDDDHPIWENDSLLPEEFQDDRWWKSRGL